MFKSLFPERHIPSAEAIHPASGATRDLLVMGYLSAVADAVERRGVAQSRIRMGAPHRDQLHGSLDLEPVGPGDALSVSWDEDNGWCAELAAPARRFLHPAVVAPPHVVSDFIADLTAGRDVGMLYPATCLSDRGPSHARVMAELARYALPEVRRWLGAQH